MKKIVSLLVLFVAVATAAFAQTQYTMGVSGTDITTCDAYIYDNGGESGNYGTGRDDWMTIHPTGGAVTIRFVEFDVAETDTLYVYNGTDPNNDSVPLMIGSLATFWVNESNTIQVGDQEASATIQNPTGALTLHFVSAANSETRSGFALLVSCAQPCQRLHARIDFANSVPTPHFDTELNDGYYYVDFCPGDTIHIAATADYPDNDYSYHQDVTTTYFDWSFGQSGYGQTDLYYVFNPGQGYDLTLSLREQHNGNLCYGQTPVAIRIRGSQDPFNHASLLDDVCQGTEIPLLISMDSAATIMVNPVGSTQESSLAVDSVVFIPDGPNCSTQCYSSSVNFTSFPPNASITSASDILGVRLNIEHSFIGDINISLICPNNRSVLLLPDHCGNLSNSISNASYLGLYYEPDGSNCNAADNVQGTGWNYCWSENPTYAQSSGYIYASGNLGHDHSSTVDSSHVAHGYPGQGGFVQGQQYYTPHQSFSNLVGCPLNGLWQIQVCDTWGSDNGYVFSWELTLDPNLMPQDWTYSVDLTGINWAGGNIVPTSDSTASIITDQPGDYNYIFTLIDEYGCEYPHEMPLKVVQQPEFNVTSQYICEGETATLDPQFEYVGTPGLIEYVWTNSETATNVGNDATLNINQNGTYSLCINTFNNDHSLTCSKCDTAEVIFNPQPIVSFSANLLENCSPLNTTLTPTVTFTDGLPHTDDVTLTYTWTITDTYGNVVSTYNTASPQVTIQDAGIYTVHLYVETQNGCYDSLTRPNYLTVYAQPISDFVSNPERTNLGEGGTIAFINITDVSVFAENDVIHWTWNYGEGDETHDVNGEHQYTQWGEYTVTLSVETEQGCQSSVSHVVYIEADLIFPNIITPNGDGKNDVFAIKNMNPLMPNILSIYDRWGKKVYEKQNYQTYAREGDPQIYNESDGFSADKLSDGVYYYTFHYEGYTKAVDYHGTLTVIRDK
jgi:gliding motility-associated-like protein